MRKPQCVGAGADDVAAGRVTTSGSRGGWRRWCLLLTVTAASTVLLSLSASQAFGDLTAHDCMKFKDPAVAYHCYNELPGNGPKQYDYIICWDGRVVIGGYGCAPYPYTYTGTLSGGFATSETKTGTMCPSGAVVVGIIRYANPFNTYAHGVQVTCRHLTTGSPTLSPIIIGSSSATSAASLCPYGQVVRGFYGRAGDVIDGFGVTCGVSTAAGATNGPYVGGFGGVAKGPFNCPAGQYLVALTGSSGSYYGTSNVLRFEGSCEAISGGLNSAPTAGSRLYRASGSQGPVKFSMVISQARDKPSSWYYAIDHLVLATSCSRAARVPGAIVVSDRRRVSQHRKFSGRRGGFRIAGRVSGPLARPKVRATVTVLKGACRGEVLEFNAVKSR